MKKLLFFLAGCLFIASIVLNFHLNRKVSVLSSKAGKNGSPSSSISPDAPVPPTKKEKMKKRVFHFDSAKYSNWRESVVVEFSDYATITNASLKKENAYRITPYVKLNSIRSNSGELIFSGDFVPGTTYLFNLAKSLEAEDGRTLSLPAVFFVKIPDKAAAVKFLTEGPILPMKQEKITLPYSVINVKEMSYEIRKFYKNTPENFAAENRYYYRDDTRSYSIYNKNVTLDLPGNKTKFRMLDLAPLLKKHGPGIYDITFTIQKAAENNFSYYDRQASKKVVLTDLGITSALPGKLTTGDKGAVFVRSLSTNLPVAGVDVVLYSKKKQVFARGRTDKDGKCILTIRRTIDDKEDKAKLLVAGNGKDITYLDLDYKHNTTIFNTAGRVVSNDTEAFLYTIRGICRPGEKIDGGLFLRKTEKGINKSVASTPVAVTLTDPAGNALPVKNITPDENGFASFDFAIPADARTGSWNIAVRTPGADLKKAPLGKCSFLVGEYVPDRIKTQLKVKNDPADITGADAITFLPAAKYYFGAELEKGIKGKLKVSSSLMQKMPAHWTGYKVGDPSAYKAGNIFTKNFDLLEKEITYPGFAARNGKSFAPVILDAVFSVAEPGGRTVSTTLRIPCSVASTYIGVSEEPRSFGKKLLIDWKLLSFRKDGKISAAKRVFSLNLIRKEWDHLLKENGSTFSYEWVCREVPVLEKDIASDALSGVFDLGEQLSGEYILKVADENNALVTRTTFWHNAGDAGKRSSNPSILSLKTDKQKYLPGETAQITFTSPGKGSLLISSGVKENFAVQTFSVKEGKNTVSVKIPENAASSLFPAGVTLLTGSNSKIIRSFALALLPVDLSGSRKLHVDLSLPEKVRPNEKISLEVTLKTAGNLPAEGSVHLFGCDAGILSLTNWKTPDIYEFFSGKRLVSYNYSDIYNKLFPSLSLLANGKFGGDGIALARKATSSMYLNQELKTQKPVLFSLGTVKTGKDGKGKAEITLPDFTGSMVITAVAADKTRTGAVSNDLLIRDRIGVTASLPRTAAPGDVLEGSFTLFNFDADNGTYTFILTPPTGVKSTGKNSFTGKLAKGGQTTHRIKIPSPEKTGNHTFKYTLVLKTKEGAFEKKGEIFLAVRPNSSVTRESSFVLLEAGKETELAADNTKWHSSGLTRTVTVDSNPLSVISDALDYLKSYPYGCLEQTAAAAFPLLSADLLVKCGMIGKDQAATSRNLAVRAAYRILSMMRFDGSFSMWPGGGPEYRTGTLFASHFLFEADEKTAFELNHNAHHLITRHLYRIADDANLSRGERAYACYILALAESGRFRIPARNILAEEKKDIASLFAAMALIKGGYAGEGAYHMKELMDAEVWREQNVPYKYADDNVRMGMLLHILSGVEKENPQCMKLFHRLLKSLRKDGSGWGTTQANAWAVMGLTSYAAAKDMTQKSGKKGICGTVITGSGKKISIPAGKKITIQVKEGEKIKAVNTSSAPLFIRSLTSGILKKAHNVSKGMTVRKEYFDENGKKVTSVKHGDLVTVKITIQTKNPLSDAVICDLLPGGLEIEDGALAARAGKVKQAENAPHVKFRENRADRFLLFCDLEGTQSYSYKARAVIRGKYAIGAITAEGMYDPDTMARYAPEGVFEIK